jgi:hypothetical protein
LSRSGSWVKVATEPSDERELVPTASKKTFARGETRLNVAKFSDHGDHMAILERFFGPDREEIWEKLADEVGGNFYDGGFWLGESKVRAKVGDWLVTLDTYKDHRNVTYTRLRAPFINKDGFIFTVYRVGSFEDQHAADDSDLQLGVTEFDDAFVIKSNNLDQAKKLFSAEKIRSLLSDQPEVFFNASKHSGWYSADFPEGVGELLFQARGEIKNLARLKHLYELFGQTLDRLCQIGSASHDKTGVII